MDGLDLVIAFRVGQRRRLNQQRLKAREDRPGQNFIAALGFIIGVDRIDGGSTNN